MRSFRSFILLISVLQWISGTEGSSLPTCTNLLYNYNGYTYEYQQEYRVWSHCNFFNPVNPEAKLCGVKKTWQDVYICDPDSLLFSQKDNTSYAEEIGDTLQAFIDTLPKDCPTRTSQIESTESIVIALIAVDAIQVPQSIAGALCENNCGEIHPFYDDVSQSTLNEQQLAAENFAVQLLAREWLIGQCYNQIVMLYVAHHNKLWFHFGEGTVDRFGEELLDHMALSMRSVVEDRANATELSDAFLEGIDILITDLAVQVKNLTSPAMILLYTFLVLLLIIGLIVATIFFVLIRKDLDNL